MSEDTPTIDTKEHDSLIRQVITKAAIRARDDHGFERVVHRTPLDELLAREAGVSGEEDAIRVEAFRQLLGYFFQAGPHPAEVMRFVYAVAKALSPELLLQMTVRDLGRIFDETPAAWSWRIENFLNKKVARPNKRGIRLPFQKSQAARESYRAAQKGNKNRAGRKKPRSRKSLSVVPSTDTTE